MYDISIIIPHQKKLVNLSGRLSHRDKLLHVIKLNTCTMAEKYTYVSKTPQPADCGVLISDDKVFDDGRCEHFMSKN